MNRSRLYPHPVKTALCFSHSLKENSNFPLTYCRASIWQNPGSLTFSFQCFETVPDPDCRFFVSLEGHSPICCDFSFREENLPQGTLSRYGGEDLEGIYWGADLTLPIDQTDAASSLTVSIKYEGKNQSSSPFPEGIQTLGLL